MGELIQFIPKMLIREIRQREELMEQVSEQTITDANNVKSQSEKAVTEAEDLLRDMGVAQRNLALLVEGE